MTFFFCKLILTWLFNVFFFFWSILHRLAEHRLNITGRLKRWVQVNSSFSQNNLDTWFASELCCCLKFSMCEEACRNCQKLRHKKENLIQGAKHKVYFLSSSFFYLLFCELYANVHNLYFTIIFFWRLFTKNNRNKQRRTNITVIWREAGMFIAGREGISSMWVPKAGSFSQRQQF